jgi:hypothetical protein
MGIESAQRADESISGDGLAPVSATLYPRELMPIRPKARPKSRGKTIAGRTVGGKLPDGMNCERQMSVSDIATALYGSTDRANEIMLANDLAEPFAVRGGTRIIYFMG